MIALTNDPIRVDELLRHVRSPLAGAEVLFLGTTRQFTQGRQTAALHYECYEDMARRALRELKEEACRRWSLVACAVVHRLGTLPPGEISVAVAVSSAHRREAFAAAQWLIDRLKETAPIWKQEQWADGSSAWVHPGMPPT